MSFPGKENLIFFEDLEKAQSRIFPDACDIGIEVTNTAQTLQGQSKVGSKLKITARENILALMKIYPYKLDRPEHARYPYDTDFKTCSTTSLFIPFEFDDGAYQGVNLTVKFETLTRCGKVREFLNIEIERARRTHNEFGGYKNV